MRERLAEQRALLTRLEEQQEKLVKALREASNAARDLRVWSESKRAELTKLLFWMPARPGTQTVTELASSLAWTVSPANWRAAGKVLWDEAVRRPFGPAAALLVVAGLWAGRRRLLRRLDLLAPATVTRERYRIGHALGAIAISAALALPGPIALGTAATLLGAAPDPEAFAHALGDAFWVVARLLLGLSAFAWLLDRRGVAVNHFGWDEASLAFRRAAAAPVHGALLAADVHRRPERAGPRAVRQPGEPRTPELRPRGDRVRRVSRLSPAAKGPTDAAVSPPPRRAVG